MAAQALTAAAGAGRRVAGRTAPALLACCSRRGAMNHSTSAQPEDAEHRDHFDGRAPAAAMTGAQVEAALNSKNVEVLQGEEQVATVLPDEAIGAGGALEGGAGEDASWVPDQETGVFVPADADTATHGGAPPAPPHPPGAGGSSSVLDQTVFVRDDMEDVERPAIDMANADANDTKKARTSSSIDQACRVAS